MIREEYLRRLVDEAYVDIYLSANDGARIYWPWRMQPPKEASMSYRNACEMYAIDSDPENDDVTTRDALNTAVEKDAEICSLQDIYLDFDKTVDKLLDGLDTSDDHEFDGDLLIPLQQPYAECYREIGEPDGHLIGLGGLRDGSTVERVKAAEKLRSEVGNGVHVHGFGWGLSDERYEWGNGEQLAEHLRLNPALLDSVDYSTPARGTPVGKSSGDEVMSVQAGYAGARLVRDLREVTPHPDATDTDSLAQAGVHDFA